MPKFGQKEIRENQEMLDGASYLIKLGSMSVTSNQFIINSTLEKCRLTEEFIKENKQYINRENFCNSKMLTKELSEKFPEYFDLELYKSNPRGIHISMIHNFINDDGFNLEKYFFDNDSDEIKQFINSTADLDMFLGKSVKVDNFILSKIEDQDVINSLCVLMLSKNENDANHLVKFLDEDTLDTFLINDDECTMQSLITAMSSGNFKWTHRVIDRIKNNELTITSVNPNIDSKSFSKLLLSWRNSESLIEKLLKLKLINNEFSQIITFSLIENIIEHLSEKTLMNIVDVVKSCGRLSYLKKYAKTKNYDRLYRMIDVMY